MPVRYNAELGDGCRAVDGQTGISRCATMLHRQEEGAVHRYRTGGTGTGGIGLRDLLGGTTESRRRGGRPVDPDRAGSGPGPEVSPGHSFLLTVTRNQALVYRCWPAVQCSSSHGAHTS